MMRAEAPRLLVAAPVSGCGKTTVTCGLLQALKRRRIPLRACKCGPDYIDPLFHSSVIGSESHNLDLFLMSENDVRALVGEGARVEGLTVIEGAMGYYDGIAVSEEASAFDVARTTSTPVVLVVDGRGRALSIAAEVFGYQHFRERSNVAGVILNRSSKVACDRLRGPVEAECGLPVLGYVPTLEDCSLESRHLGLVMADEVEDLRRRLDRIADVLEETVDLDALVGLARSAPALEWRARVVGEPVGGDPIIAVARDEAFCFYYEDSLRTLEALGARLVPFSPLRDAALPVGASGLYLGGGYPELHARTLSENASMRASLSRAVRAGMPTVAECGGFMYLHETLVDGDGAEFPEVGLVSGRSYPTQGLTRFGYVTLTAREPNLLCDVGGTLRAHEFHYWDSESCGLSFRAHKPQSRRAWDCVIASPTLYAGYPHLCLYSDVGAARRFVEACASWGRR